MQLQCTPQGYFYMYIFTSCHSGRGNILGPACVCPPVCAGFWSLHCAPLQWYRATLCTIWPALSCLTVCLHLGYEIGAWILLAAGAGGASTLGHFHVIRDCPKFSLTNQTVITDHSGRDGPGSDWLRQVRATFVTRVYFKERLKPNMWFFLWPDLHKHVSYTCLADIVHPWKLQRSAGRYFSYSPQSVKYVHKLLLFAVLSKALFICP